MEGVIPKVGDVGYRAVRNAKGRLWVTELRCTRVSPKGHSVRFETVNATSPFEVDYAPPTTQVAAIEQYQRWQMHGLWPYADDRMERVANVVEAETLKRAYWSIEKHRQPAKSPD